MNYLLGFVIALDVAWAVLCPIVLNSLHRWYTTRWEISNQSAAGACFIVGAIVTALLVISTSHVLFEVEDD